MVVMLFVSIYFQHLHSNFFGWTLSFSMAVPIEGSLKVHRFQTLSWQHLVSANLSLQAEKRVAKLSLQAEKSFIPTRWRWGGGGKNLSGNAKGKRVHLILVRTFTH